MIRRILGPLGFVILFNVVALGVLLFTPPAIGIAWVAVLGALFLWWHLRKTPQARRRRARVRIRTPQAPLGVAALTVLATLFVLFGIAGTIAAFGEPLRPEEMRGWQLLSEYQKTLPGWIALTILIAIVIPIVEEFNFRGRIQGVLQRKYGLATALVGTSLLFAITHIGVPRSAILFIPLTLGFANGMAVALFKSVWVGVATHMLWNGSMAVLSLVQMNAGATDRTVGMASVLIRSALCLAVGAAGWWLVWRRTRGRVYSHV